MKSKPVVAAKSWIPDQVREGEWLETTDCSYKRTAHYTGMIDRRKRDQAASMIVRFAHGEIDSDDLESEWPTSAEDRAIEAIGSMLWLHYDDHKARRMVGKDSATCEERALFSRYEAYLRTDLSYDWPEDNFIRIEGLGALVPLSLGLLSPIDRLIKSRNAKLDAAMDAHGDLSVWPFTSKAEWDGEPITPYVRHPQTDICPWNFRRNAASSAQRDRNAPL